MIARSLLRWMAVRALHVLPMVPLGAWHHVHGHVLDEVVAGTDSAVWTVVHWVGRTL